MGHIFMAIAALFGGLSVAAGAFGSHALRGQLSDRALEIFDTGVRYQMYHALALLAVGLLLSRPAPTSKLILAIAGSAFIAGMLLFSGSLYVLSLAEIQWVGAITPIGGVCFLIGWFCLAIASLTQVDNSLKESEHR